MGSQRVGHNWATDSFLTAAAAAKLLQSYPTPSDSMDCSDQAPPSKGFSRQEYWSGLPLSSPIFLLLATFSPIRSFSRFLPPPLCQREANKMLVLEWLGFSDGPSGKESACSVGDLGSIPGLGRSPGEGNSYPFQYPGLENSMDYIVRGVAKSQKWLSDFHFHFLSE